MTIYTDAIGNKFLGDCIWANHRIDYPTTKFLRGYDWVADSGALAQTYLSQAVKSYGNFKTNLQGAQGDASFNANSNALLFTWSPLNEPLSINRFAFYSGFFGDCQVNRRNDALSANAIQLQGGGVQDNFYVLPSSTHKRQVSMVSDGYSIALFANFENINANPSVITDFKYCGLLDAVNTNFNYYSANDLTKSICMQRPTRASVGINGGHFIANAQKTILSTGDAIYPIVCADAQSPTSQWATDMYVFDDNATLGYPAIGRVRNLLLATGTYTIGRPVKIHANTPTPDAGFNRWLPVGTFAGKTVLMRCYSSVDLP